MFVKCNLGHGPFSHMFDALFIPTARPESHWKVNTAFCSVLGCFIALRHTKFLWSDMQIYVVDIVCNFLIQIDVRKCEQLH